MYVMTVTVHTRTYIAMLYRLYDIRMCIPRNVAFSKLIQICRQRFAQKKSERFKDIIFTRIFKDFQGEHEPSKTHLCVCDDDDPVGLLGARHRQHGPEEDGDGVEQGQETGVDEMIQDEDKVADELRVRHEGVKQ